MHCRVLLKERLKLQNNQLQSLNGGGTIKDLSNLQVLDLSHNRFTKLPDQFCNILTNLRVIFDENYRNPPPGSDKKKFFCIL